VHVLGGRVDLEPVLRREPVELKAATVEGVRRKRSAVERRVLDRRADEFDEG